MDLRYDEAVELIHVRRETVPADFFYEQRGRDILLKTLMLYCRAKSNLVLPYSYSYATYKRGSKSHCFHNNGRMIELASSKSRVNK